MQVIFHCLRILRKFTRGCSVAGRDVVKGKLFYECAHDVKTVELLANDLAALACASGRAANPWAGLFRSGMTTSTAPHVNLSFGLVVLSRHTVCAVLVARSVQGVVRLSGGKAKAENDDRRSESRRRLLLRGRIGSLPSENGATGSRWY